MRDRLDTLLERGILLLILGIIGFAPLAFGAVHREHFIIVQGLATGALFLWIVRLWLRPDKRALLTPTCWGIVIFLGYALYSYSQADVEYSARQEVIKFFTYGAVFFVVLNNLHRSDHVKTLTLALTLVGTFVAAYAVFQFLTESSLIWSEEQPPQYKGRASGTYICPNHMAGFLEMACPLAIACAITGRRHILARILYGYAAVMMLAAIGLSISRMGWATTALCTGILLIVAIRRTPVKIAIIALAVIIGGFTYSKVRETRIVKERTRLTTFEDGGHFKDMRFHIWAGAIQMWQEHFWLGVGPDQFDHRFPRYQPEQFYSRPDRAHNDYLQLLADLGTVGFVIAAITALLTGWGLIQTWRSTRRSNDGLGAKPGSKTTYVLGTSIALFAMLVHAVMDFNFHIPANAVTFTILLAILSSHWRHATNTWWIKPRLHGCVFATLVAAPLIFFSTTEIAKRSAETGTLSKIVREQVTARDFLSLATKAHEIEPMNHWTVEQIGEVHHQWSLEGGEDHLERAEKSLSWFKKAFELNPYSYRSAVRIGMALDWLQRHGEAEEWFTRAHELAPSNYFVRTHLGWHALEMAAHHDWLGDRESRLRSLLDAEDHFMESIRLSNIAQTANPPAQGYLRLVSRLKTDYSEATPSP